MARELAFDVADARRSRAQMVAALQEEGIGACPNVYALPPQHQRRLCTTNALVRLNRGTKRRTRAIRNFPHTASCLRLITSVCMEQSEEWLAGRNYLDVAALEDTAEFDREEVLAA